MRNTAVKFTAVSLYVCKIINVRVFCDIWLVFMHFFGDMNRNLEY